MRPFIALFLLALFFIQPPAPVTAGTGLTVQGALLVADAKPGDTLSHKIILSVGTEDQATDLSLSLEDLGFSPDGIVMPSGNTTNQFSACSFITLDKDSLHLAPGQPQEVFVKIEVPADVGEGGRYALIVVKTTAAGTGSVGIVSAVNIPVYLTIKDSHLSHTGKITGITTGNIVDKQPIDVMTIVENTGNHHFKVNSEVTIRDSAGKLVDTVTTGLTPSSIVPGTSRQIKATLTPDRILPPGLYNVQSIVMREDGTPLDEASAYFEIRAELAPPSPPVTQTIVPGSSAVIQTDDGLVSVSLPMGAVTARTDLSIRSIAGAELPEVPPGYSLLGTCFSVDGLNGLLAKEATVAVKYTGMDLGKADNDISRLKIGRWDESNGKWTFLKSKVDESAMTVSVITDRFSTWALFLSPPAKGNLPLITGVSITGIVSLIILIALLLRKRRIQRSIGTENNN